MTQRDILRSAILVALLIVLTACERAPGADGDSGQDPFAAMDLIRAAQPTPAKDFTVPALTSASTGLSDFAGKAILLNFWATWCPPCKEEMPSMERLYRRYKDRGFTVVAVSNDATGAAAVAPFAHALRLTFPIGLDADMTVTNEYNVRGLPSTYLIDREGNVVALAIGSRKWDSAAARAVIESLLGTSADR